MAWGYGEVPDKVHHHYNTRYIQRFYDVGVPIWGATAYKGADGISADLPNLERRRTNALGWMQVNDRLPFKGIVATAWSRYSTHRAQCEPIDGSLDALLLIGAILHDGDAPLERRDACLELLGELGERERFDAAYGALRQLADLRQRAWREIQTLREQTALGQDDPTRRDAHLQTKALDQVHRSIGQLKEAGERFAAVMNGAIAPRWIDEYLAVRIEAIEDAVSPA
jgi:hypothetical protein